MATMAGIAYWNKSEPTGRVPSSKVAFLFEFIFSI